VRKILNSRQVREVDALTIRKKNILSHELMESAAKSFVKIFSRRYNNDRPVIVFCGPGNNGGDGLAISRLLLKKSWDVSTYYLQSDNYSTDFKYNLDKLLKTPGNNVRIIKETAQLPALQKDTIIIDALFGTGLNKPITGFTASLIEWVNRQPCIRVAVDIPSGMSDTMPPEDSAVVKTDLTITFQIPKMSLLLEDNKEYVNELAIADIGLDEEAIGRQTTNSYFVQKEDVKQKIKPVKRFSSKWENGHALLIAGSYEKTGAAILAATSCMRAGVGLLSVHVPRSAKNALNISIPEAMIVPDVHENIITAINTDPRYTAFGIGPGIGTNELTVQAFISFLSNCNKPVVIDADALNILATQKQLLNQLPEHCILTPHAKEFDRLTQKHEKHIDRVETQRKFSVQHKCVAVLKSAYTTISDTEGNIYFNSSGNAGMAKAGSGDVLTGIITAFLAKKYDTLDAAICGAYVHGLAGDAAAERLGKVSMKAGDIIKYLPRALKKITE